jgi:hypothetical protein
MSDRIETASRILDRRTRERPNARYLWCDALEVSTRVGLAHGTGEARHLQRARALVDEVHRTLGHHRPDDPRTGPLAGSAELAAQRPTAGGLRIGKPLPERSPGAATDPRTEWDRDGQYFHYLTQWMNALDVLARGTREPTYNRWAQELLEVAQAAFVVQPAGAPPRMYWKMSVDLKRPVVASMGQHDPVDGYVMARSLAATRAALSEETGGTKLVADASVFGRMLERSLLPTEDPLGIGGLLIDAARLDALGAEARAETEPLFVDLLDAAAAGVEAYAARKPTHAPAERRLAFRELGLALGLHAAEHMSARPNRAAAPRARLERLEGYFPLRDELEAFWQHPAHRRGPTWRAHEDIDEVTLAACLAPAGMIGAVPLHPGFREHRPERSDSRARL